MATRSVFKLDMKKTKAMMWEVHPTQTNDLKFVQCYRTESLEFLLG